MREFDKSRSLWAQIGRTPGAGDRGAIAAKILLDAATGISGYTTNAAGQSFKVIGIAESGGKMVLTAVADVGEQNLPAMQRAMDELERSDKWMERL